MDAKEIYRCAQQVQKSNSDKDYGGMARLLGDLDRARITAGQLEKTHIARVLRGVLKTCSDRGTRRTLKRLLSKWRRQGRDVPERVESEEVSEEPGPSHERRSGDGPEQGHSHSARGGDGGGGGGGENANDAAGPSGSRVPAGEGPSAPPELPRLRAKCVRLLLCALHVESPVDAAAARLAADIERHIHELHEAEPKYKVCVRSKVANLRNRRNGHLRLGLLSGTLSPEAFARMSAEEMASAELRQLRGEYTAQGVRTRLFPPCL